MAATNASIFASSTQSCLPMRTVSCSISNTLASSFLNVSLPRCHLMMKRHVRVSKKISAAAAVATTPTEEIQDSGGFNQPIMCGGEPRAMLRKDQGKADSPIYTIQICIPKNDWDGPYRLQFQVPMALQNRPIDFFNEGLAEELSKEGACDKAIFPDTNIAITRCAMIGNLSKEGGDRCNLDLVPGCTDPSSPLYNPLANVDDGSCPIDLGSDSEE